MTLSRFLAGLVACAALAGCAYPVTSVDQGGASSGVYFVNATTGSVVEIDGADAGAAQPFDGRKAILTLAPGKHRVIVRDAGGVAVDRMIYVGAGQRVSIKVR